MTKRAKSQAWLSGSQPEGGVWGGEAQCWGVPISPRFHFSLTQKVSGPPSWILLTRLQFSTPIGVRFY